MGKNDRCCVGSCNNDKRYPNSLQKRSHVDVLRWCRFTSDPVKCEQWTKLIGSGRVNFEPRKWVYVCSNHFVDVEPTSANPNPTLYLRQMDRQKESPSKRRRLLRESHSKENEIVEIDNDEEEIDSGSAVAFKPSITFEQFTCEHDIRFYTGFINGEIFKTLFNHLSFKASSMKYWDGSKKTLESSSYSETLDNLLSSPDINPSALNYSASKPGPSRKLSLETEFFMTLMKLRLDLLQLDLANRFGVGVGKVS